MTATVGAYSCHPDPLDHHLVAFLAGNTRAREEAAQIIRNRLLRLARFAAPDLWAKGFAEDVAQRVFELLLRKPSNCFDPRRGNAATYLNFLLRTSARDIRAILGDLSRL